MRFERGVARAWCKGPSRFACQFSLQGEPVSSNRLQKRRESLAALPPGAMPTALRGHVFSLEACVAERIGRGGGARCRDVRIRQHLTTATLSEFDASQGAGREFSGYDILPRIQGHAHAKPTSASSVESWAWHPGERIRGLMRPGLFLQGERRFVKPPAKTKRISRRGAELAEKDKGTRFDLRLLPFVAPQTFEIVSACEDFIERSGFSPSPVLAFSACSAPLREISPPQSFAAPAGAWTREPESNTAGCHAHLLKVAKRVAVVGRRSLRELVPPYVSKSTHFPERKSFTALPAGGWRIEERRPHEPALITLGYSRLSHGGQRPCPTWRAPLPRGLISRRGRCRAGRRWSADRGTRATTRRRRSCGPFFGTIPDRGRGG